MQAELLGETLRKHGAILVDDQTISKAGLVLTDRENETVGAGETSLFLVPALDVAETSYRTRGRLEFAVPASREALARLASAVSSGDFSSFSNMKRVAEQLNNYDAFRGLRALAVDDNTVNREVLNEALTSMGVHVETAVNGEEALKLAAENTYDIIFMDCSMPVMDGFTATRIIREREKGTGRHTPVVAITALTEGAGERGWRQNGMDGWISKPFTIPSVAERISALVLKNGNRLNTADRMKGADSFSHLPLLDEPTISMIARLSSGGSSGAAVRVHALFASAASTALESMKAAVMKGDLEQQVANANSLKSVARSAGANRLAAAMEKFEEQAKAGRGLETAQIKTLNDLFKRSERELVSRLGLKLVLEAKAG